MKKVERWGKWGNESTFSPWLHWKKPNIDTYLKMEEIIEAIHIPVSTNLDVRKF